MMEIRSLAYRSASGTPVLESGVMIRHLVLPGCLEATRDVLRWFADHGQGRALLSLMTQYTPMPEYPRDTKGIPNRYLSEPEYEQVLRWLEEFDIEEGFYQELLPDSEWLPDFSRQNPFNALATPVWHWKEGFVGDIYQGYSSSE
jgi:putative pyruvate formate lyase activating enzyme